MIEVQSLTRRYGQITAVDKVSFSIADNEIVGLLGHNGAGKSTIMKMLSGYLEPGSGHIEIAGVDMAENPRAVQQQLGYLPENLPVYPEMSVADYLDYAATIKGIDRSRRSRALRAAILATDLGARALDPIGTLSRGLKQRVGVAQAILGEPRLLILDEPTNGLDPGQTEQMRELIKRLARQATVILSTHIMQEVEAVCDRVLVLNNGRLVLDEELAWLRDSRSFLLRSCDSVADLGELLRQLPQVNAVEQRHCKAGQCEFILGLREDADPDIAAAAIGEAVVNSGARLYSLVAIVRDLDSVFREATRGGADDAG
jgi:ABC-2 type transport system ATP-binding protein